MTEQSAFADGEIRNRMISALKRSDKTEIGFVYGNRICRIIEIASDFRAAEIYIVAQNV